MTITPEQIAAQMGKDAAASGDRADADSIAREALGRHDLSDVTDDTIAALAAAYERGFGHDDQQQR